MSVSKLLHHWVLVPMNSPWKVVLELQITSGSPSIF